MSLKWIVIKFILLVCTTCIVCGLIFDYGLGSLQAANVASFLLGFPITWVLAKDVITYLEAE